MLLKHSGNTVFSKDSTFRSGESSDVILGEVMDTILYLDFAKTAFNGVQQQKQQQKQQLLQLQNS